MAPAPGFDKERRAQARSDEEPCGEEKRNRAATIIQESGGGAKTGVKGFSQMRSMKRQTQDLRSHRVRQGEAFARMSGVSRDGKNLGNQSFKKEWLRHLDSNQEPSG